MVTVELVYSVCIIQNSCFSLLSIAVVVYRKYWDSYAHLLFPVWCVLLDEMDTGTDCVGWRRDVVVSDVGLINRS